MQEPLPTFRYHPDPIGTGFIKPSDAACACCERVRGYIYTGAVYSTEELAERLCPWCIADGSAARRFDADFSDVVEIPHSVPTDVVAEVTTRTPSFIAWQQENWLFHCDDGAAFLGVVGRPELEKFPDALEMLRHEHDEYGWTPEHVEQYIDALEKDGQPTAYLFRCQQCGTHLAYSDST